MRLNLLKYRLKIMKKGCFILLLIAINLICKSQTKTIIDNTRKSYRDSIVDKYVKNGAWHYAIFTHEWQNYLDSAIKLDPTNSDLWQQRAMPYFKCGKNEVGMKYLDKGVELNPELIDYRAFMKCIFCHTYESAIFDFEKAAIIKGHSFIMDHTYDFYLGLCYLQLDKFEKAEFYLNRSIEYQTKAHNEEWVSYLDWFYLGVVYYEQEKNELAIKYFDRAIKEYSHFSDAKYYKVKCLVRQNKLAEVDSLIKEALSDQKIGYTINEGNSKYEKYPYQITQELVEYEFNIK